MPFILRALISVHMEYWRNMCPCIYTTCIDQCTHGILEEHVPLCFLHPDIISSTLYICNDCIGGLHCVLGKRMCVVLNIQVCSG